MVICPNIVNVQSHLSRINRTRQQYFLQFSEILSSEADIQIFYAKSLERLAESIPKLVPGKHSLKDLTLCLQKMLVLKANHAKGKGNLIKNQLIPKIKQSQKERSSQGIASKDLKELYTKIQNSFSTIQKLKQQLTLIYSKKQKMTQIKFDTLSSNVTNQLKSFAQKYNPQVDQYYSALASVHQHFKNYEILRRKCVVQIISSCLTCEQSQSERKKIFSRELCDFVSKFDSEKNWSEFSYKDESSQRQLTKIRIQDVLDQLQNKSMLCSSKDESLIKSLEQIKQEAIEICSL